MSFTFKSPVKCQKFLNTEISKIVKKSLVKCFGRLINSSVKTFCQISSLSTNEFYSPKVCAKLSVMIKVSKEIFTRNKFRNQLLFYCFKMFLRVIIDLISKASLKFGFLGFENRGNV